jgi:sugar (pentulose or hexulose) kinase
LYFKSLEGDADCGGLMSYGYLSGENITHMESGCPLFVHPSDSKMNLANFMRTHLFSSLGALKIGLDILMKTEGVQLDKILGHGGLFKTEKVGQSYMAAAINAPVTVMETAGEGGAWGIALLASYMINKSEGESLADYLDNKVFAGMPGVTLEPNPKDVEGFNEFIKRYSKGLPIERAAIDNIF